MSEGLEDLLGLKQLELNYSIAVKGIDGECFNYSVYLGDSDIHSTYREISDLLTGHFNDNIENVYLGYIDITNEGDKINIFHDLGNTDGSNEPIHTVLKLLNRVNGITEVIINENVPSEDAMMDMMRKLMAQNGVII